MPDAAGQDAPRHPSAPGEAQPPLEPMAVAGLVCSVLGACCCLGGMAGIILGNLGLRRIHMAQGRRRGTALAWAAILLGTLLPLLQLYALSRFQAHVRQEIDQAAISAISETLTGNPNAATTWWVPERTGGAPADQVEALGERVSAELGALREVRLTGHHVEGVVDLSASMTFTADFARGTLFGSAEFRMLPDGRSLIPAARLLRMEIEINGVRQQVGAQTPTAIPSTPPTDSP